MLEIVFKVWYFVAIMPFLIFLEGSDLFANFLKKRGIYQHWDYYHSGIVLLAIVAVVLWMEGYR